MSDQEQYDVVIVGGGTAGALIAKRLTHAKLRVLLLEAGPGTPADFDEYTKHLEHFYSTAAKGPESPWPPSPNAPQPDTLDLRSGDGYFVQNGPQKYASSYTRLLGGSSDLILERIGGGRHHSIRGHWRQAQAHDAQRRRGQYRLLAVCVRPLGSRSLVKAEASAHASPGFS